MVGVAGELNQTLERAGRVADFLELAELMCRDALAREESCGCHFREEHASPTGRPCGTTRASRTLRPGSTGGEGASPVLHKEELAFEFVKPSTRSYR